MNNNKITSIYLPDQKPFT